MLGNYHQQQSYNMIIKLEDQRSILVIPRYANHLHNQQNNPVKMIPSTITELHPQNICTLGHPQNLPTAAKCQFKHNSTVNELSSSSNGVWSAPQKCKQASSLHQQAKQKLPKRSIVDELTNLALQNQGNDNSTGWKNRLESLEWVQTNSFHESESYDFDDNQSEILELTPEERQFFTNFVHQCPQPSTPPIQQEPFIALELIPSVLVPKKSQENESLPVNKTKITRNFFRVKASMIKDERTCCNSETFLEEQMKKAKLKQQINLEQFNVEQAL